MTRSLLALLVDAAIDDALTRIAPTLGGSAAAEEVRAVLRAIRAERSIVLQRGIGQVNPRDLSATAVQALARAIERLATDAPELAVQVDALRTVLTILQASSERMHKPF